MSSIKNKNLKTIYPENYQDLVQENEYLQELLNNYENELLKRRNQVRYLQNIVNRFIEKTQGIMYALNIVAKEFKEREVSTALIDNKIKELENRKF